MSCNKKMYIQIDNLDSKEEKRLLNYLNQHKYDCWQSFPTNPRSFNDAYSVTVATYWNLIKNIKEILKSLNINKKPYLHIWDKENSEWCEKRTIE